MRLHLAVSEELEYLRIVAVIVQAEDRLYGARLCLTDFELCSSCELQTPLCVFDTMAFLLMTACHCQVCLTLPE